VEGGGMGGRGWKEGEGVQLKEYKSERVTIIWFE
jgi:hypothetical protein